MLIQSYITTHLAQYHILYIIFVTIYSSVFDIAIIMFINIY